MPPTPPPYFKNLGLILLLIIAALLAAALGVAAFGLLL